MTDQPVTPAEQVPSRQQAPEGYIEIARYNGLVRKVEELTLRNRELEGQLTGKTSEIEQLHGQLALKDTEKTVAVGERDKQLQSYVQEKSNLERELEELRAFKLKVQTAKKLGRPDLVQIVDKLPNMSDPEALEAVLKDFASFADDAAARREKELLMGTTPLVNPAQKVAAGPASETEWNRHIESLPLGSPDRQKAMDDYWDWLAAKHK